MDHQTCLLRRFDDGTLCSPLHPLYIALHGTNGDGGRVGAAEIPKNYAGVLTNDSPVRESQQSIYNDLDNYVESFEKQFDDVREELRAEGLTANEVRIKSLYLWSESPGTGKTTTAVALLNEYILRNYIGNLKRQQTPGQRPGYFLDANTLQTDYNTFNRPRVPDDIAEPAAQRYYRALEKGKHTDFVVIDDIATRDATDGFRGDLHSVINYRVTNELPTVYTSNIPINQLPEVYGEERLADRISDLTNDYHFNGKSKRGKRT